MPTYRRLFRDPAWCRSIRRAYPVFLFAQLAVEGLTYISILVAPKKCPWGLYVLSFRSSAHKAQMEAVENC
jgi:hypothetical protein